MPTHSLLILLTLITISAAGQNAPTLLEGEKLAVRKVSGQAKPQDLRSYKLGSWSGSAHL